MIDQEKFIKYLQNNGIEFITGVPDTLLNDFCLFIENQWPKDKHIIAANEGNAVAIAAGYHLATAVFLWYICRIPDLVIRLILYYH